MGTAILSTMKILWKMSHCSARWSWSSNYGLVMLFECWVTMKHSFDIFKTNIFGKVLVTDERIIQNICWAWHHRSIIIFTTVIGDKMSNWGYFLLVLYWFQNKCHYRCQYWTSIFSVSLKWSRDVCTFRKTDVIRCLEIFGGSYWQIQQEYSFPDVNDIRSVSAVLLQT